MKTYPVILMVLFCGITTGMAGGTHEPDAGMEIGVKSGNEYTIIIPLVKIDSCLKIWMEGTGLYVNLDTNSFQIMEDMYHGYILYGRSSTGNVKCAVALELRENRFFEKTILHGPGKFLVCLSESCDAGCEPRMVGSDESFCTPCDSSCMKDVTVNTGSRVFK